MSRRKKISIHLVIWKTLIFKNKVSHSKGTYVDIALKCSNVNVDTKYLNHEHGHSLIACSF